MSSHHVNFMWPWLNQRLAHGVTLPSPSDSWDRLQQSPILTVDGCLDYIL